MFFSSYSFHIPLSKRQTPPVPLWKGKIREYPAALYEQWLLEYYPEFLLIRICYRKSCILFGHKCAEIDSHIEDYKYPANMEVYVILNLYYP